MAVGRTEGGMSSEKRRISSDSGDAYARAVRREERQQEREQDDGAEKAPLVDEADRVEQTVRVENP